MSGPTDAELMVRVRDGDRDAFGQIVDRHKDSLVGYACRLTGCPSRAEDVAQEAFLRLFQFAPRYQENGQLVALLLRIATNLVRSEERRNTRWRNITHRFADDIGSPSNAGGSQQSRLISQERHEQLASAIAELPLKYRVPLVLHDIEGWSYDQVAGFTDSRQGTIKSRISRARQRLREKLGQKEENQEVNRHERPKRRRFEIL